MDISPAALRKLRHALEDQPDGVVDELGLLALHTGYGERFFPGTSVLQTRARYLFFVPWVYLELARSAAVNAANVRERKQRAELHITEQLKKNAPHEPEGIIGTRTFPSPPAQPADFAYWTALCAYGFYEGIPRSTLLARWDRRRIHHRAKIRVREETPEEEPLGIFDVPEPPDGWPGKLESLSFALTKKEAERLREGFRRPGASLLAAAADALGPRAQPGEADHAWNDPFLGKVARSAGEEDTLLRAEQAAFLAQIARCTYAAHVELLREEDIEAVGLSAPAGHRHYRARLEELLEAGVPFERAASLDIDAMKRDIDVPPRLEGLVVRLRDAARRIGRPRDIQALLLDTGTRELLRGIESSRKGPRARLHFIYGRARREDFGPASIAVDPLHYRWRVARRLLLDLHQGLFS
ncbi:hypothetical protein BE04_37745 [Sorangium cellulosum]|uniref:Uncharacterized protein n=1 Tax=Sorangium cellulosum TaxID=56 RepID=A0A150P0Y5_SORCE|nr:hypothetical protein BE04_37745 [Sorangium cellulosum]